MCGKITRLRVLRINFLVLAVCSSARTVCAQVPNPTPPLSAAPDWAQPGSTTHVQVAPPAGFHRASRNFEASIGIFDGQSDIGSPVVAGSAAYDATTPRYVIRSAG